jgi:hypothetical protein
MVNTMIANCGRRLMICSRALTKPAAEHRNFANQRIDLNTIEQSPHVRERGGFRNNRRCPG